MTAQAAGGDLNLAKFVILVKFIEIANFSKKHLDVFEIVTYNSVNKIITGDYYGIYN